MQWNRLGAIGVLLGVLVPSAHATNARCTIEQAGSIIYTLFEGQCGKNDPDTFGDCGAFNIADAVGRYLDVTFDQTGAFTIDGTGWGGEIGFPTIGVNGFITLDPVVTQGTIDAGGNVMIPGFQIKFDTDYCSLVPPARPRCGANTATFNFTTAMGHVRQSGSEWLTEGVVLDFATGEVVLTGHDASTLVAPQVSGLRVRCRLDTIPQPTALPKAAVLATAKGKVTSGGDVTETSTKGDHLTLAAKLVGGGIGVVDPATNDLFLKITAPDGTTAGVVLVRGADLTPKKKTLIVDDADGSKLQILHGLKQTGNLVATGGGKLTLKAGKKFTTVNLSLDGLDLTKLLAADATAGTFRLQIGRDTAAKAVVLKAAKAGRKFK